MYEFCGEGMGSVGGVGADGLSRCSGQGMVCVGVLRVL